MGRLRDFFRSKAQTNRYERDDRLEYARMSNHRPHHEQASASAFFGDYQSYQTPRYRDAPAPTLFPTELPSSYVRRDDSNPRTTNMAYGSSSPSTCTRGRSTGYTNRSSHGWDGVQDQTYQQRSTARSAAPSELPTPLSNYSRNYSNSSSNITTRSGHSTRAMLQSNSPAHRASSHQISPSASARGVCYICLDLPSTIPKITRDDGNNPNRGREYLQCTKNPNHWNGFTDNRGLNPVNPLCQCGILSRLVSKNRRNAEKEWDTFFSCKDKKCGFWQSYASFDDVTINAMISRREI
ncbi:hypothetical protein BKA63DRAFT_320576 [Paraphoma chrysanthemicola]|nr:hypothetical protein BKA63DRAFT_320576 [Paraphoma chrysanthemicola]